MKSQSEVIQLCLTLSDLVDCSLPVSSVHEVLQARVLEWGARGLECCNSWVCKESDTTEWLNWTEDKYYLTFPNNFSTMHIGGIGKGGFVFFFFALGNHKFHLVTINVIFFSFGKRWKQLVTTWKYFIYLKAKCYLWAFSFLGQIMSAHLSSLVLVPNLLSLLFFFPGTL